MNIPENLRWRIKWIKLILFWLLLFSGAHQVLAEVTPGGELEVEIGYIQLNVRDLHINPFLEVLVDSEGGIYLPLSKVFLEMELYLFSINWQNKYVAGLVPPENDYYYFNYEIGLIQSGGHNAYIPKKSFIVRDEEIFMFYETLGEWLPVDVNWDPAVFEIYLYPEFQMVSEIFDERKEVREKLDLLAKINGEKGEIYKIVPSLFTPGVINYQLKVIGTGQSIKPGISISYVGPLLYGDYLGNLEYYYGGKVKSNISQLKYRNFYGLKNMVLGDNLLEFSPLVKKSTKIMGITVESDSDQYKFGRTSLTGYVPPGSDVELYYLGMLIDYQTTPDGVYHFEDVSINNTINFFDLVTYTREGRIYRERKYVLSRDQLMSEGKISYQGGAGFDSDGLMVSGRLVYGIDRKLTLGGTVHVFQEDEEIKKYLGGILLTQLKQNLFLYLNLTSGLDPTGVGYLIEVVTVPKNWVIKGKIMGYSKITPPLREHIILNNQYRYLDQEMVLSIERSFGRQNLNFDYSITNFERVLKNQFNIRYSHQLDLKTLLQVENELTLMKDTDTVDFLKGSLFYSGWSPADFRIESQLIFGNYTLKGYNFVAHFSSKKDEEKPLSYAASLVWGDGNVNLMGSLQYNLSDWLSIKGAVGTGIFNMSLTMQDTRSIWPFKKLDNESFGTGRVEGRVYLDYNGNGQWDEDEQVFSNVRILVNDFWRGKTGPDGRYEIEGIKAYDPVKISIDVTTIDALYSPLEEEKWVELCPGTCFILDFGLVPCSGLSGIVLGLWESSLEKVELTLENSEGEIVYNLHPEYDGFFVLDRIEPGRYILKVRLPEGSDYVIVPSYYEVEIPFGEMPKWYDGIEFRIQKHEE